MISLESLFETLQSATGNNIQLASSSSYGYYGYYGESTTERYVLRGYFARAKDQTGKYNKYSSYYSPLVIDFKNSSGDYAESVNAPYRKIDENLYVFIPTGWAEDVYLNTISTGVTGYSWGTVHSACQGPNTSATQDYRARSFSTNEALNTSSVDSSLIYYYIIADGQGVGFCQEMNTQVVSLSNINVAAYSAGDVTISLKYTYTINVQKLTLKSGPHFGNIDTILDMLESSYASGYNTEYFNASDAGSDNCKFQGMVEGSDATNKTNSVIRSNVISGTVYSGTFTSYKVTQENPSIITNWRFNNNQDNRYIPVIGLTPMALQNRLNITDSTATNYYKNLVDAETKEAYGYFPLISINFYTNESYTFYLHNLDVFFIRVILVKNGSVITGSELNDYKLKYNNVYYPLTQQSYGDSGLYHNASITQSPNNIYLISSISGDSASTYSNNSSGVYFGFVKQHAALGTYSISLTLCNSSLEELSTLTLSAYKTESDYNMNYFVFNVGTPRLYIGGDSVKKVYIGSTEVKEVWIGGTKVFP